MNNDDQIVGLFPAGGLARRLGLSGSKEVIQVFDQDGNRKPVGSFLLQAYATAGIRTTYVVLRKGKWDICQTYGNGNDWGLQELAYLILRDPWGTPFTIDQAWPFYRHHIVALGFPDIVLYPQDCFLQLREYLKRSTAEVVLGLFPTDKPQKADMVEYDKDGSVKRLLIKPAATDFKHTWVIALWRPGFSAFMHDYLHQARKRFTRNADEPEIFVGTIINQAIQCGMRVEGVAIQGGKILDIGTPDDFTFATSAEFSDWLRQH